jgi:hypothetical protein
MLEAKDVAAEIKRVEDTNQKDLRRLAALINNIINVLKGYGRNAIARYDGNGDKLLI